VKDLKNISFHALAVRDAISSLETDQMKGLSASDITERKIRFGLNSIAQDEKRSAFLVFLNQFKSPIVFLLLIAAGLSITFGDWTDAIAILIVLLVNSLVGFYMEFRAERSMQALKKLSTSPAKVIRDGKLTEINSESIVPGDVVFIEAGDLVSADGRIITLSQLQADESPLTGESIPVEKQLMPLADSTTLAERTNMLYKGTYISKGNAYFIATGTGLSTELGKVANLVRTAEQSATPLEKKLEEFSKKLIWITIGLVIIIFFSGLLNGQKLVEMLETSIALAVAAIPEGLPIVATMALAQGMIQMARHNVIVKKLSAVETLGGTSVICTDKTGTLTKNKIEVTKIESLSEKGKSLIVQVCILCNTAEVYQEGNEVKELGDPLEVGLLYYATGKGFDVNQYRTTYPKINEEPFSSETKIMATMHKCGEGLVVFAKGAVEELIKCCAEIEHVSSTKALTDSDKSYWLAQAEKLAASGLRVIAAAYKRPPSENEKLSENLIFLGLIGMIDPPREEVFSAIQECKTAGINIMMITGDHPATARNIAAQLNIAADNDAPVLLGKDMRDFENLSEAEKAKWEATHVFARVSPKQKLDLISVLQEKKKIVAMTGDGINDAPALKKADIGVAMGLRGTQVAQEVADMILKDDSFSSIVLAIRHGRVIFENIRKFVIFLLSCNLSELLVISIAAIFNLHFQLFPLQILFINLITDVLPALALGMTEGGKNIMNEPPRNIGEPILDKKRWYAIFAYSVIIGVVSVGAVLLSHSTLHNTELWNPALCNNILFFSLIFSQLLHVFNMGSRSTTFFKSEIVRNKYTWIALITSVLILLMCYLIAPVQRALELHTMSTVDWLISTGAGLTSMILIHLLRISKLIKY
jgi:P-type Ca2+ transporter type 2C